MRLAVQGAMTCAMLVVASPASAQTAQQWQCTGNPGITWDVQVEGCTKAIGSGVYAGSNLAWAYHNRGNAWRNKGEHERAMADYNEAIRLDPKHVRAYNSRGVAWRNKGEYDRAIADYTESIRLDPKYAAAYNNRSLAWRNKGEHDRAIADATEAIRLDPKLPSAYNIRGASWNSKGEYDRAIADYTEAIRLDPNGAAYGSRAAALNNKGEYDRAIVDLNEAIRLDPKDVRAYVTRGAALSSKGEYERAIADLNEAIRHNSKLAIAYGARGRAYLHAGNAARALADLHQASALDPKDAYYAIWVDITGHRNKISSRLADAARAIDMTKWPAPVIRLLLGQSTLAVALAAADDPDPSKKPGQVCEANFYGGEWAQRQGNRKEAVRLYWIAAKDCPRGFLEWGAAKAELKALGETP